MSPNGWANLAFFVLFAVFAYLLFIRPARKRAAEADRLQAALSVGDEIMLTSGIFGRIHEVDNEAVHVEVAGGVIIRVHRGAVGKIVTDVPTTNTAVNSTIEPETDPGAR
ncbi:MAG: preprotein translocase subunit YajC [Nocardioidaceae bacterium]